MQQSSGGGMQENSSFVRIRKKGVVAAEFLLLFFVVLLIIIAVVNIFTLDDGDDGIPPYRAANAMYVYNALERVRLSVVSYYDVFGALPGDDDLVAVIDGKEVKGNLDGRIDQSSGEAAKVFKDMAREGVLRKAEVRIRGLMLELLYVRFLSKGEVLQEGNFFRLVGMNRNEAVAMDRKFDDGRASEGDVLYVGDGDTVTLYYKLLLYG